MANLPESATWEGGIYQLEKTDPVDGGPDGISNNQAKQLANRTAYLKQEVELRAPLNSPALTGNPTAPTQAPGTNNLSLANTAFVQAALAALVDSSPGALDTLNELAAALGDDPNFAATVMNALAGKADILRGVPTGTVAFIAGDDAPAGWLKLNGAVLSRAGYSDLWAHANNASGNLVTEAVWNSGFHGAFSTGDGGSTFRIPDARGEFLRAWDDGRGIDAGRALGSWQKGSAISVDGTGTDSAYVTNQSADATTTNHTQACQRLGYDIVSSGDYPSTEPTYVQAAGTGGFGIGAARPRNISLMAIIKY